MEDLCQMAGDNNIGSGSGVVFPITPAPFGFSCAPFCFLSPCRPSLCFRVLYGIQVKFAEVRLLCCLLGIESSVAMSSAFVFYEAALTMSSPQEN